jgi:hypothetical protein
VPGGGPCATIDLAAATALLGATPKQLAAPTAASTDDADGVKVTKIEGCSYTGTDPSLGYDVNHFDGMGPVTTFISAAKAQMGAHPGVTPFDVGLGDQSVGFTVPVGPKTMARVEVAKGQATIAVVTTGTDPAKATAVAIEATRRLWRSPADRRSGPAAAPARLLSRRHLSWRACPPRPPSSPGPGAVGRVGAGRGILR